MKGGGQRPKSSGNPREILGGIPAGWLMNLAWEMRAGPNWATDVILKKIEQIEKKAMISKKKVVKWLMQDENHDVQSESEKMLATKWKQKIPHFEKSFEELFQVCSRLNTAFKNCIVAFESFLIKA